MTEEQLFLNPYQLIVCREAEEPPEEGEEEEEEAKKIYREILEVTETGPTV